MKTGVLFMPADPPSGAAIGKRWHEVLEAAEVAEEAGFSGIFLPEHHFMASGFCSSPLVALGAIAARTRTLQVGTSVLLLPCYHPLKLAEDAAHLDLFSSGRLILGVGMGAAARESEAFGVAPADRASRYEESFEVLRRAWSGDTFSFEGKHFRFRDVQVTPRPVQHPHPPLWMGGMSPAGARRAGRFGVPWMTSLLPNFSVVRHLYGIYEQECRRGGHTPRVVLIRDAWVDSDPERLAASWWTVASREYGTYVKNAPEWMTALDAGMRSWKQGARFAFEEYAADRVAAGTPQQAARVLRKFMDALPIEYLVLRFRLVTGPSQEETLACLRRFAREALPALEGPPA